MTTKKLTGGQMIVDCLIREGVEHVFAIPGHGNTALLDAFVDRADEIEVIPAMHEQGAAHMADGYYRASGKIAAVCTSIGPGATNTLTGLAPLSPTRSRFSCITGAVHTYMENRGVLQEIDRPHGNNFPRMAEPVVKRWWQPSRRRVRSPRSGRRPSTPCTKDAAARCWSTFRRTCRRSTASTRRSSRLAPRRDPRHRRRRPPSPRPLRASGDRPNARSSSPAAASSQPKPAPELRRHRRVPRCPGHALVHGQGRLPR